MGWENIMAREHIKYDPNDYDMLPERAAKINNAFDLSDTHEINNSNPHNI